MRRGQILARGMLLESIRATHAALEHGPMNRLDPCEVFRRVDLSLMIPDCGVMPDSERDLERFGESTDRADRLAQTLEKLPRAPIGSVCRVINMGIPSRECQ